MIILILALLGLCFGSFVNALVWRINEQSLFVKKGKKQPKKGSIIKSADLSVLKGRSMCPECHHTLAAKDLIPVLSWLELRGKCRYCQKPISWQYPLVESATALLFVLSYLWWPYSFNTMGTVNFVAWCALLTGFMALVVYDLRWMMLPNRITYPLIALSAVVATLNITAFHGGLNGLKDTLISLTIASGFFYLLFQMSKGKWIGGGDVKFGLIAGFIISVPFQAFLVLFFASLIGTVIILPGMIMKKITAKSHIPFGPFLIVATIIVKLFGASIISWYRSKFLLY
jgi:prepilin signal peptidase PulO-like enzyme (type II secretory pathway)